MNFFLTFKDPLHEKAYESYLQSKWSAWNFALFSTVLFLGLSSILSLTISFRAETSSLTECYQIQSFFGFSLTLLGILFFITSRWKCKSNTSRSVMAIILTLLNMVVPSEIYFHFSKSLDSEDKWLSYLNIVSDKVLPALILAIPYHTWMLKSVLVSIILSYSMVRSVHPKLIIFNIIYACCANLMFACLFYKIEKARKSKFLTVHAAQTHDKLMKNLFSTFPEGLMILTKSNKPIYINQTMKGILGTEETEAIMQKINGFKFDFIIPEVQKHCDGPLNEASYFNNSPSKSNTPAESPEKSPRNFFEIPRVSFDKSSIPPVKSMRSRDSRIGLPVPSLYLDDLMKLRRKMSKKHSKEHSDDFRIPFRENSFLECPSPGYAPFSKSKSIYFGQAENVFKLKVEGDQFKGCVTNPVKNNQYIIFNLYEEPEAHSLKKSDQICDDLDYAAYEVKYREFSVDNESYKVLIMSDISQRERRLNIEESTKYKNLMFSSISHEFRTPVNGILGLLEATRSELKTHQVVETHIKPAIDNAQMLLYLINDLLDYSKILVNKLSLSLDSFSVRDCLEEVKSLMEAQAHIKNLSLQINISKNAPSVIKSDRTRIQQILVNLLSNAIKFTKQGGIEVFVEGVNHSSKCLKISVRDTGIGLNAADLDRLNLTMNDGYLSQKVSRSSSGIGIGLMITQSLALALGPSDEIAPGVAGIAIDSRYGEGSVFQFVVYNHESAGTLDEIPTVQTMPDERSPHSKKSTIITTIFDPKLGFQNVSSTLTYSSAKKVPGGPCNCAKVLIVDDTSYNIFVLKTLLNSFGIQSDTAYDGREACRIIIQESRNRKVCCGGYRLIFMDCNMPMMDGYEATREIIREIENDVIRPVPIIGWTAYTDKDALDECINAGMTEVVTKPVPVKTLEDILKKYGLLPGN